MQTTIPEFDAQNTYNDGLRVGNQRGRYECGLIEQAIGGDNAPMMRALVDRGILTPEHRTLFNDTVVHRCDYLGKTRAAAALRELGFPER